MALPQQPEPLEKDGRVVKFSPRKPAGASARPTKASMTSAPGKASPRPPIDYRQRMMANVAAIAFTVALAAAGYWLINSLNHMRQVQDCVAMGLRNCDNIENTPHS